MHGKLRHPRSAAGARQRNGDPACVFYRARWLGAPRFALTGLAVCSPCRRRRGSHPLRAGIRASPRRRQRRSPRTTLQKPGSRFGSWLLSTKSRRRLQPETERLTMPRFLPSSGPRSPPCSRPREREDSFNSIVAHLACTRQHVARALDELETEGVVERTSNNVGHDANVFANKMEGAQGRRATSVWHGDRKFALTATGVARVPAFRALHAKTARRSTPSVTV